jgi:hypothetical protein
MSAQQRLTCLAERPERLIRHYSRPGAMSSENQERSRSALWAGQEIVRARDGPGHAGARGRMPRTPEPGHASRRDRSPGATCPLRKIRSHADRPVAVVTGMTGATSVANGARSRMRATSCSEDTLIERLAQDLQAMAAALGPCIQEEHAVVGQRHLTGHRDVAPTDQADVGDGVVRRAPQP